MSVLTKIGRRWRSVSFRSGLLSALSVGIVASLAFFAVSALVFVLFVITGGVGQSGLVDRATDQLRLGVDPADLDLDRTLFTDGNGPDGADSESFWVVMSDGERLNSDGPVSQRVIDAEFADSDFGVDFEGSGADDQVGIKTVEGEDWFYVERAVDGPDERSYLVIAAFQGTFSFWAFARSSFPVTIPLLLVLMGVAMAVTSWLTRRTLRRVERMRSEVEQITQQSLDRRVPVVNASDDIEKLGHTMNDMLGRLETSAAQQNQFLADASHELRSPVAGLLAQLDVATAYPDKVDSAVLLPKLRNEAQRLQLLVNDLLFLSRSEAELGTETQDQWTTFEVGDLLEGEVDHQLSVDPATKLRTATPVASEQIRGNRRDVERALRNLVDNALRHCETEVLLSSRTEGSNIVVSVSDDGPGVADADADRIFDRFVRLDDARTRDTGGAGLGLAIASEIASKHGGSIRLSDSDGPGATFELRIPFTFG